MSTPIPHVDGVSHRTIRLGDLDIHVAEAGDPAAPALVLLHGWPQHWYSWRAMVPLLAPHYRLVMPDLRGMGWSGSGGEDYHKESFVDDLLGVLDALGLQQVRLIGHDWGGWTGFLACLRAPERFESFLALNIVHPWQRLDGAFLLSGWRFWYQFVLASPFVGGWLVRHRPGFIDFIIRYWSKRRNTWSDAELAAFSRRFQEGPGPRASVLAYRQFLTEELPAIAFGGRYRDQRLKVRTKVLFGSADHCIAPRLLRGWEGHADEMEIELVDAAGHFIAEETPEIVADRALRFFAPTPALEAA